jgi:hypothetical protein
MMGLEPTTFCMANGWWFNPFGLLNRLNIRIPRRIKRRIFFLNVATRESSTEKRG